MAWRGVAWHGHEIQYHGKNSAWLAEAGSQTVLDSCTFERGGSYGSFMLSMSRCVLEKVIVMEADDNIS